MFSRKTIRILIVATIVLLLFVIIGKKAGWFGKEKPVKVAVEKVIKRTIYEIVTADGKIQPETEVKVSADVSGEIVDILFKEGDSVRKNQLLLKIKPDIYVSSRDRAVAAVDASKANNANAKARLEQIEAQFRQTTLAHDRNKKLWEQKIISQSEWENSVATYEVALANVEAARQDVKAAEYSVRSAEASLKESSERLIKTSVFSPIDGIITRLDVEKGERVAGTDLMAGTEMIRIADLKNMEVKVDVNENDIVRVKIGDTANVEVDAYLGQKFKGIVTEIANSASSGSSTSQMTVDQITNYEVKILLIYNSYKQLISREHPYPFRPGMTATVEIQTEKKDTVLSVPIEAVTARSDSVLEKENKGNKNIKAVQDGSTKDKLSEIVFRIDKSYARTKKVKTGIQDNNYIEIIEGLKEGDEIVVAPYSAVSKRLKDSTLVLVVDKKELFSEK